jgi:hypothetical protein
MHGRGSPKATTRVQTCSWCHAIRRATPRPQIAVVAHCWPRTAHGASDVGKKRWGQLAPSNCGRQATAMEPSSAAINAAPGVLRSTQPGVHVLVPRAGQNRSSE